jgi:hypothetical protein
MDATLGDATITWALVRAGRVTGHGRVAPRLRCELYMRTPRERMSCQIQLLQAELSAAGEALGEGFMTGIEVNHGEYSHLVEIPLSRQGLEHLGTAVVGNQVEITLRLTGWMRVRDDNEDAPRYANTPEPGSWEFVPFGRGRQTELRIQVARSDWHASVLEPIGTLDYISTEIAIPASDLSLRPVLGHLQDAERAYATGDDPTVFARCRAATEALPGAPKEIFAALGDRAEAEALDALLLSTNRYLHRGRHVAADGDSKGEFPVTHADAGFAINLAKLIIANATRVLTRGS